MWRGAYDPAFIGTFGRECAVTTTISGGSGTATLLAGPLGIAFTKAG